MKYIQKTLSVYTMKKVLYVLAILVFGVNSIAQKHVPYEPTNMGDSINSEYAEVNPVISPDDSTLYFSRYGDPKNGNGHVQDIWVSEKLKDGSWGPATKAGNDLNLAKFNAVYAVLDNGNSLLINGVYSKKTQQWKSRGLSKIYKRGDDWEGVAKYKIPGFSHKNKGKASFVYITEDESLMLLSFATAWESEKNKMYLVEKKSNGKKWKRPKKLKASSMFSVDQAPIFAPTLDTIFFATNNKKLTEKENEKLDFDVYYITKLEADSYKKWSDPKPLELTNTDAWESYFRLNKKGNIAYFATNRDKGRSSDIYHFKRYEEKPYWDIEGNIRNSMTNEIMGSDLDATLAFIEIKDSAGTFVESSYTPDSLVFNDSTMSFKFQVPFGKKVVMTPTIENYNSKTTKIDLSDKIHYEAHVYDAYVEPLDFALVTGRIMDEVTGKPVSELENFVPEFYIDGNKVDSIDYDPNVGIYSIKMPLGKSYDLEVRSTTHTPIPSRVNLENYKTYTEVTNNIRVKPIPDTKAYITGHVYSKKDSKPITGMQIDVLVNGTRPDNSTFVVDTAHGVFELTLETGDDYILNVDMIPNDFIGAVDSIMLKGESEKIKMMKDFYLTPIEIGQSVEIKNIYFESGKAVLKPESFPSLDEVVKLMAKKKELNIQIEGHTDNTGATWFNKVLSKQRAEAVAAYISSQGITSSRITTMGYGPDVPKAKNDTEEGRSLNRRVEFTIKGI